MAPVVTIISPADGTVFDDTNNITAEYTVTDDISTNLSCGVFYLNGTEPELAGDYHDVLNNTLVQRNFTNVPNGTYIWNVACVDESWNLGMNPTNFTVTVDFDEDDDDDDQGEDDDNQGNDNNGGSSSNGGGRRSHSSGGGFVITNDDNGLEGGQLEQEEDNDETEAGILEDDNVKEGLLTITGDAVAEDSEESSIGKSLFGILLIFLAIIAILWATWSMLQHRKEGYMPEAF